jgi:rubredoxin
MGFQQSATRQDTRCDRNPAPSALTKKSKRESGAMAKLKFDNLPQGNPCAQCGKPISTPEWIESGPSRVSYLWHCWACDYQFEAVAFFEQDAEAEPLAA